MLQGQAAAQHHLHTGSTDGTSGNTPGPPPQSLTSLCRPSRLTPRLPPSPRTSEHGPRCASSLYRLFGNHDEMLAVPESVLCTSPTLLSHNSCRPIRDPVSAPVFLWAHSAIPLLGRLLLARPGHMVKTATLIGPECSRHSQPASKPQMKGRARRVKSSKGEGE